MIKCEFDAVILSLASGRIITEIKRERDQWHVTSNLSLIDRLESWLGVLELRSDNGRDVL
jgi:hypothetical protein